MLPLPRLERTPRCQVKHLCTRIGKENTILWESAPLIASQHQEPISLAYGRKLRMIQFEHHIKGECRPCFGLSQIGENEHFLIVGIPAKMQVEVLPASKRGVYAVYRQPSRIILPIGIVACNPCGNGMLALRGEIRLGFKCVSRSPPQRIDGKGHPLRNRLCVINPIGKGHIRHPLIG